MAALGDTADGVRPGAPSTWRVTRPPVPLPVAAASAPSRTTSEADPGACPSVSRYGVSAAAAQERPRPGAAPPRPPTVSGTASSATAFATPRAAAAFATRERSSRTRSGRYVDVVFGLLPHGFAVYVTSWSAVTTASAAA